MAHKCDVCGKRMREVDDIDLQGFLIRGWRCACGNAHSNSEDVDAIVKFFRYVRKNKTVSIFKAGNSLAIRLPKPLVELYRLSPSSKLLLATKESELIFKIPQT